MDVYLFTMLDCEHCIETKKRLQEENIEFKDLDIVIFEDAWENTVKITGNNTVPTLVIVKEGETDATVYSPNEDYDSIDELIQIIKTK